MDVSAPWPLRLVGWMGERFPPLTYTFLVLAFHASAVAVARGLGGWRGQWAWLAVPLVWLVFLHLRIFDEHKDFEGDRAAYPDRLLSRGVVGLGMLTRLGTVVVLLELILATWLGWWTLVAWVVTYCFTMAMRWEFGVGGWLEEHILVYAITHNPVVAGLCLIIHAASGAPWRWGYLWFLAFASLATLAFEIARKTNLPYQEHVGVPSYTSELGQRGARWLLCATYLGVAVSVAGVVFALGGGPLWAIPAGLLTSAAGWATAWGSAERVELGASLVLLAGFAAAGGVALVVT